MFESLRKKVSDVTEILNPVELLYELFMEDEFRDLIIRLNTEGEQTSQLIYGIDSKGKQLDDIGGEYSPYTVMLKKDKGQITDHVTLKDTGEFYHSFRLYWLENEGAIHITADTMKDGGDDLITRWGQDIIGLDEQNLGVLRDYAKQRLPVIIENKLKSAA
jgi:hypothetical protein